jgi:NAD(P)-dependent dehydrogenase (short-subunit alcohol dehydrogenase family)
MAVAQRTVEAFERIDVLVNAAGTDVPGPIVNLPLEEWDRVLNVNLRASFLLAKAVFPYMRKAAHGTIGNWKFKPQISRPHHPDQLLAAGVMC